ncbi:MAG: leucine-rich repeat domain-containing protein, partial [Oscillospiraceae bacterium]|nr:leucine-rich repeat domain-containing protein [Oscillospiraceae bacterium]
MESITLPDSLELIDYGAFGGCSSLRTVTIGSGTKYIYDRAFSNTPRLESIYFRGDAPLVAFDAYNINNNNYFK